MREQERSNRTLYTKHVVSDAITWRVCRTLTQMATSELFLRLTAIGDSVTVTTEYSLLASHPTYYCSVLD